MEFSEEQQTQIDKLINKRVAEVKTKAETDANAAILAVEQKHSGELQTLQGQLSELQASRGETDNRIKKALLTATAIRLNAVNEDQVTKLISDQVRVTGEGNLTIIDSEGNTLFDETGKEVGVEAFLSGYLDENPHLKSSSRLQGAGSQSAGFNEVTGGKTMRRGEFDNLDSSRQNDYIRSGGKLDD